LLFDPDFRLGSYVDEVVIARHIVMHAATKLHCDPLQLLWQTIDSTKTILRTHERTVRAIADELMTHGVVRGDRLAQFLQSIGGNSPLADADDLRVEQIAAQLEEAEQQRLTDY
jgi:hypothetical protein